MDGSVCHSEPMEGCRVDTWKITLRAGVARPCGHKWSPRHTGGWYTGTIPAQSPVSKMQLFFIRNCFLLIWNFDDGVVFSCNKSTDPVWIQCADLSECLTKLITEQYLDWTSPTNTSKTFCQFYNNNVTGTIFGNFHIQKFYYGDC